MSGSKDENTIRRSTSMPYGIGEDGYGSPLRHIVEERPQTPVFDQSPPNRHQHDPKCSQHLGNSDTEISCDRQIDKIMYGARHSLFVTGLLGLRVVPAALASYYNFLFSTAFNHRLFGADSRAALFLSYLVWLDNAAINHISMGKSSERIIQDLIYKTPEGQNPYFAQVGRNRTYLFMALAFIGAVPNLKMVYDAMSARPDLAYLTIPMTICQGFATTGSNYRGLLGFSGYLYPGEANKYNEYTRELVKVITSNLPGKPLKRKVVKKLLEGKLTKDSLGKKIAKIIVTILSLPYAFVSFLAAFGFFTYHTTNQVVAAVMAFFQVSVAVLGMVMKALLLNKSNYSIIEAIWPNNQILPSDSELAINRGERPKEIRLWPQRAMAVTSFAVGALTLGGAAEGVKKYLLDHFITDQFMMSKLGLSYAIAFVAAGGINMKDFYDLFMVEAPGTIRWWQEQFAEQRVKCRDVEPLEFLVKALQLEPRSGIAILGNPGRPTIECRQKPEFGALLTFFNQNRARSDVSLNDEVRNDVAGVSR